MEHASKRLPALSDELPDFPMWNKEGTFDLEEWILIQHNMDEIKRIMWDYVGIVRSDLRLERALRRIDFLETEIIDYYKRRTVWRRLVELRNLVTAARLIIEGAMARKESRGLHYNMNYPGKDEKLNDCIMQNNMGRPFTANLEDISFDTK